LGYDLARAQRLTKLERQALNLDIEQGVDHNAEVSTLAERLAEMGRQMEESNSGSEVQADELVGAAEAASGSAGLPE
jgi:hypothetical protein